MDIQTGKLITRTVKEPIATKWSIFKEIGYKDGFIVKQGEIASDLKIEGAKLPATKPGMVKSSSTISATALYDKKNLQGKINIPAIKGSKLRAIKPEVVKSSSTISATALYDKKNPQGKINIPAIKGSKLRAIKPEVVKSSSTISATALYDKKNPQGKINIPAVKGSKFPVKKTGVEKSHKIKPRDNSYRVDEKHTVKSTTVQENVNFQKTKAELVYSKLIVPKKVVLYVNDAIDDIDKTDKYNQFLLSIYVKDIYAYLKTLEVKREIQPNFLHKHPEVTPNMRSTLVNWLIDVHQEFSLMPETLHITVGLIDTYLQKAIAIRRQKLQLVGITALFIASKYEETCSYVPDLNELVSITDNAFTRKEILLMEQMILSKLHFDISRPISLQYLRRYSKAGSALPKDKTLAKYISELALVETSMCSVLPSKIAAASLYVSFFVGGGKGAPEKFWNKNLVHYTGYVIDDLKPVAKQLATFVVNMPNNKLQAAFQKYSHSKYNKVSVQPCLLSNGIKAMANGKI